jgi:hypothetical protein
MVTKKQLLEAVKKVVASRRIVDYGPATETVLRQMELLDRHLKKRKQDEQDKREVE